MTKGTSIDIESDSGLRLQVLPRRGLDLGRAVLGDESIGWIAPGGVIQEPVTPDDDADPFMASFGGGLMLTCGLHNVGLAAEGQPWNGRYSLSAAVDVTVTEDTGGTTVRGVVHDEGLTSVRTVLVGRAESSITVADVVTNDGSGTAQAPIMYHVNLGPALVDPSTEVLAAVQRTEIVHGSKEPSGEVRIAANWARPFAVPDGRQGLLTHWLTGGGVTVRNARTGLTAELTWSGLDRVHQWIDLEKAVLGIEPANASQYGRELERVWSVPATLGPGESRSTSFTIALSRSSERED